VNLQSYFATADLALLEEGELAGLSPYLIGRPLGDEVAVIATSVGRPFMLRTIPLDSLGDGVACGIAAAYWAQPSVDGIWLVGHSTEIDNAAAAITGLAAALEQRGLCDKDRLIHLDPTRRNWRYVHENDVLDWGPIRRPDPLMGRLAALVFHTACIATREAEAFAPRPARGHRNSALAFQERITNLRELSGPSGEVSEYDEHLLADAIDFDIDGSPLEEARLIDLGVALAASPGLLRRALAVIWNSEQEWDSGFSVWAGIAKCTDGRVRAIGCALSALATWRLEDPLAPIAAREALAADADCGFAQAVSSIVTSGAVAANFVGDDVFVFLTEDVHEVDAPVNGAEDGVA
jgi:hypothetical protein